jgi:hypothetical protein
MFHLNTLLERLKMKLTLDAKNQIDKGLLTLLKEIGFKDSDTLDCLTPEESFDRFIMNVQAATLGELWDAAMEVDDLDLKSTDILAEIISKKTRTVTIGSVKHELATDMERRWHDLSYMLWLVYLQKLFKQQEFAEKLGNRVRFSARLLHGPEYEWHMDKRGEPSLGLGLPVQREQAHL